MISHLQKARAFQLLQEDWEQNGTGIDSELTLKHFLREHISAKKAEQCLPLEVLRCQFIGSSSQVCSREDLKKGRVKFRLNDEADRFWMILGKSEKMIKSWDAFCEFLKANVTGQFTNGKLQEMFRNAQRSNPLIIGGLMETVSRLIKCNFLLISFSSSETCNEEYSTATGTDTARRNASDTSADKSHNQKGYEHDLMSEADKRNLIADKNGIYVSLVKLEDGEVETDNDSIAGIIDFGCLSVGETKTATLRIIYRNEGNMTITDQELMYEADVFRVVDKNDRGGKKVMFTEKDTHWDLKISYSSVNVGTHKTPLVLRFLNENGDSFPIWRFLNGQTKNEEMDEIKPTAPYKAFDPRETARDPSSEIIPGVPPEGFSKGTIEVPLDDCKVPRGLQSTSKHVRIPESWKEILEQDLTLQNHKAKFDALLYIEEMQMEVDIRRYDMKDAEMTKESNDHLGLKVPGLAENRPSLIPGDRVYVQETKNGKPVEHREYEGFIHFIEEEKILLKFKNRLRKVGLN
eukprot:Seg1658.4 transcript_id=Seg1658.4/GoldUCD/mRNA.D3Y31 product="putative helicase MOV-10" protein_id=Seg1658.4/GoldUCD/D3Y31